MAETAAAETAKRARGRGRPFVKGQSGNPAGRPPGSKNRSTLLAIIEAAGDVTPLEYLLSEQGDEREDRDRRLKAACAAAPFCHPKVSDDHPKIPVHVSVNSGGYRGEDPREQLAELFAKAAAENEKAAAPPTPEKSQ